MGAVRRDADVAVVERGLRAKRTGRENEHGGQCGQMGKEAGVGQLVLSHFYTIADRYDVKAQAGEEYHGKIWKGKDLLTIQV